MCVCVLGQDLLIHLTHWLLLYLLWRSSTPQRSLLFPGSCELKPPSEETQKTTQVNARQPTSTVYNGPMVPSVPLTDLGVPDVHTLVKGAAGEVPAVGAEGHAVDGLLVASQSVDAHPTLHVPQTNCGVK